MSKAPVPSNIQSCLKWWNRSALILRAVYAALTILSIVCSVVVGSSSAVVASGSNVSSSKVGFLEAWQVAVLSMIAAISVGILSALDIRGNADRMRKAWRKLNVAVTRYESERNFTPVQLNAEYDAAEKMISGK